MHKHITGLIIILAVALLIGCIGGGGPSREELIGECENLSGPSQDDCYFNASMTLDDTTVCQEISEPTKEKACEAVTGDNPDLCEELESEAYRNSCLVQYAAYKQDPSICADRLEGMTGGFMKDTCFFAVASAAQDPGICEEVEAESQKNYCFAITKEDSSYCADAGHYSDSCYLSMALNYSQPELCDKIKSDSERETCFLDLAEELGDASLCDQVEDEEEKQDCYLKMLGENPDPSICPKLSVEHYRNNCFNKTAVATQNKELCSEIEGEDYLRIDCYSGVAVALNDISPCADLTNEDHRSQCYREAIKKMGKPELCDQYFSDAEGCKKQTARAQENFTMCEGLVYKLDCYEAVAGEINDSSQCASRKGKEKDACYYGHYLVTGDSSLCDKAGSLKDDCLVATGESVEECEEISNLTKKYSCYEEVAVEKADLSICDMIPYEYQEGTYNGSPLIAFGRSDCYAQVAQEREEPSLCLLLDDSQGEYTEGTVSHQGSCVRYYARNTDKPAACDVLEEAKEKGRCYAYFTSDWIEEPMQCSSLEGEVKDYCYCYSLQGRYEYNLSVFQETCGAISDPEIRDTCLITKAQKLSNVTVCEEEVSQEILRVFCVGLVAKFSNNPSLCSKIPEYQSQCEEKIEGMDLFIPEGAYDKLVDTVFFQ